MALAALAPVGLAAAHGNGHGAPSRAGASCFGKAATISGTSEPDKLTGTPGRDVIVAGGGGDTIRGRGGNDLICGGAGRDLLVGGAGADALNGGGDADTCEGDGGQNRFVGCELTDQPTADRAPHAGDVSATTAEDAPLVVDVVAASSDPDKEALAVVGVDSSGTVGTVAREGTRSVRFDPAGRLRSLAEGQTATTSFGYTVADAHGGAAHARVTVTIDGVDDPPAAVDDAYSLTEDDPASAIDVLANDTDVDGGPRSIVSKTDGGHGTVTITGGGTGLAYQPAAGYCNEGEAPDTFTYALNGGSMATVSVTVACVDDPPTAVDDTSDLTEEGPETAIDVLANDTDVDGGPRSIVSKTDGGHGTVTITGGGTGLAYQPAAGYCNEGEAPDTFTYALNGGSMATVSVTVACVTSVTSSPALWPKFDPSISDYTVKCDGSPLDVSGRTGPGTTISVDGQAPAGGSFDATVPLEENQEFGFSTEAGGTSREYFVRCLPSDFPTWEYEGLRPTSHQFYAVTPTFGGPGAGPYAVIFDDNGVPVWWFTEPKNGAPDVSPNDVKILPDGTVAWWAATAPLDYGYEIRNLDGTLLHRIQTVIGYTDFHEFQIEPNGDYLLMAYKERTGVDLTAFGGGAAVPVADSVIQEISPNGELKWEWSTADHIGLAETGRWWPTALAAESADIVHINAIEPVGDEAILISLRHTDAVYKIDKASGEIVWKLGGTWTPKSLTVVGDPQGAYPLGGQHDVRMLEDGTITISDNNTNLPSPPRAVRYRIDEAAHTATLVEEVTDPLAPSSFCCGSARRSPDGSWLMSWGGRSLVTEFDGAGQRTFRLEFGGTAFSYRAVSAPEGVLSATALRDGMDFMHPR